MYRIYVITEAMLHWDHVQERIKIFMIIKIKLEEVQNLPAFSDQDSRTLITFILSRNVRSSPAYPGHLEN